LQKIENSQIL